MKGSSEGTLPVLSVHAADRDGRGPPYYQAVPEAPTFGEGTYAPDEQQRIQELLNSKLGREHLATRQGPGGSRSKLTYVEDRTVTCAALLLEYVRARSRRRC